MPGFFSDYVMSKLSRTFFLSQLGDRPTPPLISHLPLLHGIAKLLLGAREVA